MQHENQEFQDAVDYVHGLSKYGWKLGLERFSALCERLGSPQDKLRVVHVAGTNGKGSTTAMISSILHCAGYKVGTYYSPFVYDIRERVQVDGQLVTEEAFARLVNVIKPHAEALAETEHGHPTEFEVKTALGFLYFLEQCVDFAVLEVGLGGRLDATNIVTPLVSVITNVTLDHMDRLGNTVAEIAGEKAGIIKENGHLVTAAADPEAFEVIRRTCVERNSVLWHVRTKDGAGELEIVPVNPGEPYDANQLPLTASDSLTINGMNGVYSDVKIGMSGDFQLINAATAIGAVEVLIQKGISIDEAAIRTGLESAYIPGRLEVLQKEPLLVIDGAHNLDGARQVASALKNHFHYDRLILVMGMVSGHSIENVIGTLAPLADKFYATSPAGPRSAHAEDVAKTARKYCSDVIVVNDVKDAVLQALGSAGPHDMVCVTGSFYTIGEVPRP